MVLSLFDNTYMAPTTADRCQRYHPNRVWAVIKLGAEDLKHFRLDSCVVFPSEYFLCVILAMNLEAQ